MHPRTATTGALASITMDNLTAGEMVMITDVIHFIMTFVKLTFDCTVVQRVAGSILTRSNFLSSTDCLKGRLDRNIWLLHLLFYIFKGKIVQ